MGAPGLAVQTPASFSRFCKTAPAGLRGDLFRLAQATWVNRMKDYRDCFTHYTPTDTMLGMRVIRRPPPSQRQPLPSCLPAVAGDPAGSCRCMFLLYTRSPNAPPSRTQIRPCRTPTARMPARVRTGDQPEASPAASAFYAAFQAARTRPIRPVLPHFVPENGLFCGTFCRF